MSTRVVLAAIALGAAAFHLYAAGVAPFTALVQRPVHLLLLTLFACAAAVLARVTPPQAGPAPQPPGAPPRRTALADAADGLLVAAALVCFGYLAWQHDAIMQRVGVATGADIAAGAVAILVVLELARRAVGWPLVVIAGLAIGYAFAGPHLPGMLAHRGYGARRIIEHLYLSTEGIWGVPLGVSADFVFLFVLFGALLHAAGGGELLVALASRLTGRLAGGPALTATVASGFMGSLSGSAVANVATTGAVTIPLMQRAGFSARHAGAIEAAASTGGQLVPPVMGAGAFILATWTNIPYAQVALAALLPAVLYYAALLLAVHFRAVQLRIATGDGLTAQPVLPRIHLLLPLLAIVLLLATGRSPMRAAFWGVVAALVIPYLRRETRLDSRALLAAFVAAARGALPVAAACAAAGIVVGVASLTGIGLRMSTLIIELSGGSLPIALALTAAGSLILGMGLPTTAAYVVLAALGAPALVELGVPLLAAHLFIFYFGCISNVTPPVSLAAFTAAGIAGAPAMATAFSAAWLALAGFIIPFMFVYGPELLLDGSPLAIAGAAATALAGVAGLAAAIVGHARRPLGAGARISAAAAALLLIRPDPVTDIFGLLLLGSALLLRVRAPRAAAVRHTAGLLLVALAVGGCGAGDGARRFYSIGTGGTGGLYYPLGGAIAARLSSTDAQRTFTAEVTGASGENVNRILRGEMDLGFAISTTVHEAYHGGDGFPRAAARLRVVAPLYANMTHVLVSANSPVRSVADLRGRRVSVGSGGSGTELVSRHVLEAHGLAYDDIQPRFLTFTESTSALADGAIDAAILSVGYPASAVLEATATGRARLLPIDGTAAQSLVARFPYYTTDVIPAGSYPGQAAPVATVAVMNWIVARDDLEADVVRAVLDLLHTRRDELQQTVAIAGQIDLARLAAAPVPLHDAARAWMAENGLR